MEGLLLILFYVGLGVGIIYCIGKFLSWVNRTSDKIEMENKIQNHDVTKTIIQEILKSNYIDIHVYTTRVDFDYNRSFPFSSFGYENMTLEQARVLAIAIRDALPNKELYKIVPITSSFGGGGESFASVRHAVGDYSSSDYGPIEKTVGYNIHNKNYDGRFYKVYNKETGKYDTWDCKERKWVREYKKW